jgi:hypothetical protein
MLAVSCIRGARASGQWKSQGNGNREWSYEEIFLFDSAERVRGGDCASGVGGNNVVDFDPDVTRRLTMTLQECDLITPNGRIVD